MDGDTHEMVTIFLLSTYFYACRVSIELNCVGNPAPAAVSFCSRGNNQRGLSLAVAPPLLSSSASYRGIRMREDFDPT